MQKTSTTILVFIVLIFMASTAAAEPIVTGSWNGQTYAGGSYYPNNFLFTQSKNKVAGSGFIASAKAPGVITGTVSGNRFSFHSIYAKLNYSSDAIATTDGQTMSGTFIDSQGTTGTFTLTKYDPPLSSNLVLPVPPVVQLKGQTAVITCPKFPALQTALPKTTISYELTRKKGSSRQKINFTHNKFTVRNLSAAKYQVSCRGQAIRSAKVIFSSKASPSAVFTVK